MAKSGPQKYPGASTQHWWQSKWGGDAMETNTIVWHSTEGTSVPDYSGGSVAPNLTAMPDFSARKLRWYQHFDFDTSSRALVNKPGGVQTNTLNVCQVEVVGTCDPSTHRKWGGSHHLYMPDLPDWAVRDLGAFAKWAHDHHGVPLHSGLTFKAYPGSYGGNGVRMSGSAWERFHGHCGHQHVPENCVHPDTPVLGADLRWRRAGELRAGDVLAAFDEAPAEQGGGPPERRYRRAAVLANRPAAKESYRVTTATTSITASADHPWLVRPTDPGTGAEQPAAWVRSAELDPLRHRIITADRAWAAAAAPDWVGAPADTKAGDTAVVRVEPVGVQPVASLSTDTRTYIADGLLCHNSHGDPGAFPMAAVLAAASGSPPNRNGDDDVPIRSSLGKTKHQSLKWHDWTVIDWDREYQDNEHVHADGNYPGYVSPAATWADMRAQLHVTGMRPGDYYQLRYEVHDWKDGKSSGKPWTEIEVDAEATTGDQYVTGSCWKGLGHGQHVYVALAVFPGPDRSSAPAPQAVSGRWTIRQDSP